MLYNKYFKRLFDVMLSFIAIILLMPIFAIVYLLVLIKIGSPVFYVQERLGLNRKVFKIYKFRTMNNKVDEIGNLLPDEYRLLKFGKILRSTSLDELPQLFNIFKGEMSIIGPRALLVDYFNDYTDIENLRHNMKPGLVGLAALHGRGNQSWRNKFEKDIYYIEHCSFILDLKILIGAIKVVLSRENIDQDVSNKESFYEREKIYEYSSDCSTQR